MPSSHDHDVVTLTQALIRCQSLTPSEAGCFQILSDYLLPRGFRSERCDRNGVANVLFTFGDYAQTPTVGLAGHVDVVPAGPEEAWKHGPWSADIDHDGVLWGRGAVDMKGALAAMVVAAAATATALDPQAASIALLITSDEEGPAQDGTRAIVEMIEQQGWGIDWCIVGEPSCNESFGDTLRPGRRGSITVHTSITGKAGHVAYPDRADNACHQAAQLAAALATESWDTGFHSFPPTSCQVTKLLSDSGAENVVPGAASLQANWRFNPASPTESIQQRFATLADHIAPDRTDRWVVNGQPFKAPETGKLVIVAQRVVHEVTGLVPQLDPGGGTSDGRFVAAICPEIIEFGPINATIHQVNERVPVADLLATEKIYRTILLQLLMPRVNSET
jgi:succinyl-diaminopimelate desuccinylase